MEVVSQEDDVYRCSERSHRIMDHAERVAEKTSANVLPIHLIIGALLERSGACAELYLQFPGLENILTKRLQHLSYDRNEPGISSDLFTRSISQSTQKVIERANEKRKRYKQVYLNEGLLLKVVFEIDGPVTSVALKGIDSNRMISIAAVPRDMIVSLKDYILPEIPSSESVFRRAEPGDKGPLKRFVEKEFGKGWLETLAVAFQQEYIPIYLAERNEEIIGFSCFDAVRKKKGLFGPMGTSSSNRLKGVGYALLHHALNDMKEKGYEYAVIGEAGPLEFYEKACHAVVIPKTFG